jgi:hypothetical protein
MDQVRNTALPLMRLEQLQVDRIIDAFIPHDAAVIYPSNFANEQGVLVKVYAMRAGAEGIEIQTGYAGDLRWFPALAFQLGWDLCDGCKNKLSHCECEELKAAGDWYDPNDEPF